MDIDLVDILLFVNYLALVLFNVCYSYQYLFFVISLLVKDKPLQEAKKNHRYGVLIAARNEEVVIAQLINSIKAQDYPQDLVDVFVIADNCTDNTAQKAREAGAIVYERENAAEIGKGYALDALLGHIMQEHWDKGHEGFMVFDADNVLDKNFIKEMNKLFDQGYRILTSYRNCKNFSDNWISAGYALNFIRDAHFMNKARMRLGTPCVISGTGYLLHRDIVEEGEGWKYYLLTEDAQFTAEMILKGERIGYCGSAMLYDEQPTSLRQSWTQRLRWMRGFYQVLGKCGPRLVRGVFSKRWFSCFDMLMQVIPAAVLTLISTLAAGSSFAIGILSAPFGMTALLNVLWNMARTIIGIYGLFFVMGLVIVITQWAKIHGHWRYKIGYLFTSPIYMLTYMPISLMAIFKKVQWTPIRHVVSKSIEDVQQRTL